VAKIKDWIGSVNPRKPSALQRPLKAARLFLAVVVLLRLYGALLGANRRAALVAGPALTGRSDLADGFF